MTENIPSGQIKVDAIFIAQQFERLNTTLEFFGKQLEEVKTEARAQDRDIDILKTDMVQVKQDIRSIKDSKPPRLHPVTMLSSGGALVAVIFVILDRIVAGSG